MIDKFPGDAQIEIRGCFNANRNRSNHVVGGNITGCLTVDIPAINFERIAPPLRQRAEVVELRRSRIGTLTDKGLRFGFWRPLSAAEVAELNALAVKSLQALARQNGRRGRSQICARRWGFHFRHSRGNAPDLSSCASARAASPHRQSQGGLFQAVVLLTSSPGVDHANLAGTALKATLKEHKPDAVLLAPFGS